MNHEIISKALKALAAPVRLQILLTLKEKGEMSVGDIVLAISPRMAQPTITQHLKILRERGLVKSKRVGVRIFFAISKTEITKLRNNLLKLSAR